MGQFVIHALEPRSGEIFHLRYDNQTSELTYENGTPVTQVEPREYQSAITVSFENPVGKIKAIKSLKIQLGLSCNYSCEYCSQRFVPHADETTKNDVEPFLSKLPEWFDGGEDGRGQGVRIEFWGGEPFVYWKTLKPLAEKLRELYPNAGFWFPTNGSLLDDEKNEWIDRLGFDVSISHDGPGQYVRGPDPFENPKQRKAILDLFHRLHPQGRISFNACMNRHNQSRAAVIDFFKKLTGCDDVRVGEGAFIDPYDEGGKAQSLQKHEMKEYSVRAFEEIRYGEVRFSNSCIADAKVRGFINSIVTKRPASALGQKCGMDRPDRIAVNLRGEVLTCQNVSSVGIAPNGKSHRLGVVNDLGSVKLTTATHWSKRKSCNDCPVLQLCQGSCMFLEGDLWDVSCDNSYADNIPFFAAGIEIMTGLVPIYIEGDLPDERKHLWPEEEEVRQKPKKVIPIKAIG